MCFKIELYCNAVSEDHEKQNQKNRSMPQLEDESTNAISLN